MHCEIAVLKISATITIKSNFAVGKLTQMRLITKHSMNLAGIVEM
jgi:hypothetical protein